MTWIATIEAEAAEGRLKKSYERIKGHDGQIDNILKAHSLRPHGLEGHMALYKSALHHSGNKVAQRLLEAIGVYVSHLNGCAYCVEHHYAGLCRFVERDNNVDQALRALKKKLQREGVYREMKMRRFYEKPSEKRAREHAAAIRRARKLERKRIERDGGLPR